MHRTLDIRVWPSSRNENSNKHCRRVAQRGPRLSIACRNPVSTVRLWGSCRMHVLLLLHAAVAAMIASAALSVAHAHRTRWSMVHLSQGRSYLSATSVGTVAMFAEGLPFYGSLLRIPLSLFVV